MSTIEQLDSTADILRLLMDGLSGEDAVWKPAPDRYSVAEVIAHLCHAEGHCFRARLDRMMEEDNPSLEPYDDRAFLGAGAVSAESAEDAFDHFEEQRETNVDYLMELPAEAVKRTAIHPAAGPITVEQMLHQWVFHDLGHVRQVAELVRQRRNFPGMGPLQGQV